MALIAFFAACTCSVNAADVFADNFNMGKFGSVAILLIVLLTSGAGPTIQCTFVPLKPNELRPANAGVAFTCGQGCASLTGST